MKIVRHAPSILLALILLLLVGWIITSNATSRPPKEGITVLLDGAPKGLDPRFATSDFSVKLSRLLFSALVTIDNDSGKPEFDLAENIEVRSPLEYHVTLRKDATWHDGKPLTAEDVRFTYMELGRETIKSPYAGLGRKIKHFEIHNPHAFTLHLHEPHAPFLSNLVLGIVPKHAVTEKGLFPKDTIVGSGPFQLDHREGDQWLTFLPFEHYHGGKPATDRLTFKIVEDGNTRLLTLMSGGAHMVQNATKPLLLPVLKEDKDLVIETSPSFKYTYLGFNMEHPILGKPEVRKALAYAIDREEIITHKFRGSARLATGLLSPEHWAYNPNVTTYTHDLEKAKALLDKAGYPDPDGDGPQPRFEITYKTTTDKFRRSIAELFAIQLGKAGIKVRVQAYEWGTFFSDIKSRNFEVCSLQWPSVTEPDLYSWIFHSKSIPTPENRSAGANRGAYKNQNIDKLLDQGRLEHDPAKRKAIYAEVQRILAEELPYISLWHEDNILVRHQRLQGYTPVPNARFRGLTHAHLE